MQKIIHPKGYTVEVVSWENDGDNYKTLSYTVDTLEEANDLRELAKQCYSTNSGAEGAINLGNVTSNRDNYSYAIAHFMGTHSSLIKDKNVLKELSEIDLTTEDIEDETLTEHLTEIFFEYNDSLFSGSEYYLSRVLESVSITYLAEDVKAEIVE